ncbi:Putative transposase, YhgA-like [Pseudobutyrivibrio sp. ACV-2]|uniref:Rpn family recombination-promoting nuclease/putative transposase n=1 Tax=Pseudobutyrivibrio sp. ACV-2 TaxID=1520801 RepID=UPI0008978901|nr:Rpn family recombination-promoting nuclease/putative transposase [Pseudobutyrivibrio sp. ACV-2]SEA95770.1 Putative transposase, YhgA-like [Pseudobutyrivibrio sp. ACV-2]
MGRKDDLTKNYMKNPEIFADFFNGLIFDGKEQIDWRELKEIDSSSILDIPVPQCGKSRTAQKYRDIIKKAIIMRDKNMYYVMLGIENQSDVHYAMPVRIMLYDALTYHDQVQEIANRNKDKSVCKSNEYLSGISLEDKLYPVITATLYWGKEKWDAPTSLKEMLQEYDFKLDKYINDYNINLLSIIDLKTIPNFKTELRLLFALLNMRNDGAGMKELVSSDNRFQHISRETAELMSDFASIKLPKKQKEGDYNMCKAVLEIKNEGIAEGRAEGDLALTNAIKNLMDNMNKDFDEACNLLGINDEDRNRYKALM